MTDEFSSDRINLTDPATQVAEITPDDSDALADVPRAIYVGTSGDVALVPAGQTNSVVFKNVPVGVLSIRAKQVLATGTTADNLLALW